MASAEVICSDGTTHTLGSNLRLSAAGAHNFCRSRGHGSSLGQTDSVALGRARGTIAPAPRSGAAPTPTMSTSLSTTVVSTKGTKMTSAKATALALRGMNGGPQNISLGGIVRAAGTVIKRLIPGPIDDVLIDRFTQQDRSVGCDPPGFMVGNKCVDLTKALPGGAPLISPAGGTAVATTGQFGAAVIGAFGLPALEPMTFVDESTRDGVRRRCPTGMRLGKDNLCYPKGVLQKNSRFRKWRGVAKAKVSAADFREAKQAERVKEVVLTLGKALGGKGGKNSVNFGSTPSRRRSK